MSDLSLFETLYQEIKIEYPVFIKYKNGKRMEIYCENGVSFILEVYEGRTFTGKNKNEYQAETEELSRKKYEFWLRRLIYINGVSDITEWEKLQALYDEVNKNLDETPFMKKFEDVEKEANFDQFISKPKEYQGLAYRPKTKKEIDEDFWEQAKREKGID